MVKAVVLVVCVIFFCSNCGGKSDTLWVDEVNVKSKCGKDLIMRFEELERQDDYSIAKVQFTSGASVPSIMFIAKGFYSIAKIRGKKYFINLKEWRDPDDNWMYKVGFVDTKEVDLIKVFGSDIKDDLDQDSLMSVKDYDLIFKK